MGARGKASQDVGVVDRGQPPGGGAEIGEHQPCHEVEGKRKPDYCIWLRFPTRFDLGRKLLLLGDGKCVGREPRMDRAGESLGKCLIQSCDCGGEVTAPYKKQSDCAGSGFLPEKDTRAS